MIVKFSDLKFKNRFGNCSAQNEYINILLKNFFPKTTPRVDLYLLSHKHIKRTIAPSKHSPICLINAAPRMFAAERVLIIKFVYKKFTKNLQTVHNLCNIPKL